MPPALPTWGLARPGSGLTKGTPGVFQLVPRPGSLTKGTPGVFQTQPRPPGATPGTLPPAPPPGGAAPPQAPGQPAAQAPGGDSGLDATYYQNVAANQFKVGNAINGLNLQGSQAGTALQQALGNLAYQQPRAALGLEQKWNWGGHDINSTPYTQAQGDLANAYAGRQTAAQGKYSDTMSEIAAKIGALQGGVPIFNAGEALASTGRASRLAANSPAPPPETAPAPPPNVITDTTRVTPAQQLAQAIAARPVVSLASQHPRQGKGTPRQIVNVKPVFGKGTPRRK